MWHTLRITRFLGTINLDPANHICAYWLETWDDDAIEPLMVPICAVWRYPDEHDLNLKVGTRRVHDWVGEKCMTLLECGLPVPHSPIGKLVSELREICIEREQSTKLDELIECIE